MVHDTAMTTLYDEDFVLWSEQQAEALRRLGATGRVPNELDIANLVEEVEDLGRSHIASVESFVRLALIHLLRLHREPESDAVRHWRSEIVVWLADVENRYEPSMRQRIDMEKLWKQAVRAEEERSVRSASREGFPACPFTLGDFLPGETDPGGQIDGLLAKLANGARRP